MLVNGVKYIKRSILRIKLKIKNFTLSSYNFFLLYSNKRQNEYNQYYINIIYNILSS